MDRCRQTGGGPVKAFPAPGIPRGNALRNLGNWTSAMQVFHTPDKVPGFRLVRNLNIVP